MRSEGNGGSLQLNNRGVSLIELIVALLILTIIVVPLMSLFTSAARTNTVTSAQSDADIVAQNIMEAVKVYGLEGVAEQFGSYEPGQKFLGVKTTSVDGPVAWLSGKFVQTADNKYVYEMTGVEEGDVSESGHKYKVTLELDSNYYVSVSGASGGSTEVDINEVADYSLSAFDKETTVFVNPLSGAVYYDDEAFDEICDRNADLMDDAYDANVLSVQEHNADELRKQQEDERNGVNPPHTPDIWTAKTKDEFPYQFPNGVGTNSTLGFWDQLTRTMNVVVSEENVSEAGMSSKVYKVNSNLEYIIPQSTKLDESYRVIDNLVSGDSLGPVSISKSGYCHDVTTVEPIRNVYIMYTPYPYMSKSAFIETEWNRLNTYYNVENHDYTSDFLVDKLLKNKVGTLEEDKISFSKEELVIENTTNRDLEVYVIVQGNKGIVFTNSLNVRVKNTGGGNIDIYSNANINVLSGTAYTVKTGIMKTLDTEHQDKLVNVTVKVSNDSVERVISSTIQK